VIKRQLILFTVALQYLTRLPVPTLADFDPAWLQASARYFPLVGVVVGLINGGVYWAAIHAFPVTVATGLALAASVLTTGAFHEDGFADTCDGLGGGNTREQALAIMKDSRIGAYGAIGLVLLLGLKWTVLTSIPAGRFVFAVIVAHALSRWGILGLIWRLPYARTEQETKARPLVSSVDGQGWFVASIIVFPALVLLCVTNAIGGTLVAWPALLVAASLIVIVIVWLAGVYLKHRLGGYTGDTLGATQQVSELAVLLLMLASARY
jgi:adenosylcobinamide-GDP ribazoletransferase